MTHTHASTSNKRSHSNAGLVEALASPFNVEHAHEAARFILESADPPQLMTNLVPTLLRAKVLGTALRHLEASSTNSEPLTLGAGAASTSWPVESGVVWPPRAPSFVFSTREKPGQRHLDIEGGDTRGLLATIQRHRRMLSDNARDLVELVRPRSCVLLSGRAMEARYPEYHSRMEFDTDALVQTVDDAAVLIDVACTQLGGQLAFLELSEGSEGAIEGRGSLVWIVDRHLVTFGFAIGFQAYEGDFWNRAETVEWRGTQVGTPSPEDLLLLLAAKHRLGRGFKLGDSVDAQVIVGASQLESHYISEVADRNDLSLPIRSLIAASRGNPQPTVNDLWTGHPVRTTRLKLEAYQRKFRRNMQASLIEESNRSRLATRARDRTQPNVAICSERDQPLAENGCRGSGDPPARRSSATLEFIRNLPTSPTHLRHHCERFVVERKMLSPG